MRNLSEMIVRTLYLAAAGFATALLAGCGQPAMDLFDPAAPPPTTAGAYSDQAWAQVLRENVKGGLVDYHHLASHAQPLDDYLAQVAAAGPTSTPALFPDPASRLAYYLNVYNACVLKAVLNEKIPASMHDPQQRRLERGYRCRVDGQIVTLTQVREWARAGGADNALVELAMCDAAKGSPPLSPQPFRAEDLDDQLRRLGQQAVENPMLVRVDHERQCLLIGAAIWTRADAFKRQYGRETASPSATLLNCLMHMADADYRATLVRATSYDTRMLPFDRALNAWSSSAAE